MRQGPGYNDSPVRFAYSGLPSSSPGNAVRWDKGRARVTPPANLPYLEKNRIIHSLHHSRCARRTRRPQAPPQLVSLWGPLQARAHLSPAASTTHLRGSKDCQVLPRARGDHRSLRLHDCRIRHHLLNLGPVARHPRAVYAVLPVPHPSALPVIVPPPFISRNLLSKAWSLAASISACKECARPSCASA